VQALLAEDLLQEEVGDDALAHEAPLQVREHAENGVDLAGVRELFQLLHVQLAGRMRHRSPLDGVGVSRAPFLAAVKRLP
jgi:hypothetical protein